MHASIKYITICCLLAMFLAGVSCSSRHKQDPQPPPPTTAQRKEAEARQWKALAAEVAQEAQGALLQREDLLNVPIYVRPPMDTRFSQSFSQMLTSELVLRGLRVSVEQEDALILDYNVQDNVVLSASLRYNNRYVMHTSKVAYVGDQGLGRYAKDAVWSRYAKRRPVYSP